ncbi:hypothetical protein [Bacillus chungangensis]|uniref:Sodium:proton antiporter n=1 Tax=Bacillus chungangensis TaxID=587633 RepID=A0ABT9WPQ2_9BACI|nr:hypothetical protein [Bacillus chungangensis]MDQ0175190.1 hypothetical protein [Bacillus chungangensis]
MRNSWTKWIILILFLSTVYRYRYRILNSVLGFYWLRNIAVRAAMAIPGMRNLLISRTFG